MEDKTCIVSVAFRNPYVQHQKKQIEELSSQCDLMFFTDQLPAKDTVHTEDIVTHFQKSLYGFKPHAIQVAIDNGYKKIIWLDPSVLPTAPMQTLIDSLDEHPMIVRTGDAPIVKMVNKKALNWFGYDLPGHPELSSENLKDVKHIGGTVYGFNFKYPRVVEIFELWKKAEEEGIFGNQDEFMAGHWADEACMVLAMQNFGVKQYWEEKFTYYNMKNGI